MLKPLSIIAALILSICPALATTVAFDGKTLACDTQATYGHTALKCAGKVFYSKLRDEYLGFAGDTSNLRQILKWFNTTTDETSNVIGEFQIFVLDANGRGKLYSGSLLSPSDLGTQPFAIGSGSEYALAAMACGKTAEEAVHVAADLDIYTNHKVIAVEILKAGE